MSTPVLDLRGVAYAYPDGHQALFGVNLHVHRGERVALLGPNGAGKTTLVLHLNGILRAGAGTVAVSGLSVADDNLLEIRRRVGIVFQDPDDQLFMPSVRDDVGFGPANLGLDAAEIDRRVEASLRAVGMLEHIDRPPHHLSFGQEILDALPVTVLMVTHDLPYALQLCERSVILSGGVIAADGPTATILSDAELLAAHRLELPFGFDRLAPRPSP